MSLSLTAITLAGAAILACDGTHTEKTIQLINAPHATPVATTILAGHPGHDEDENKEIRVIKLDTSGDDLSVSQNARRTVLMLDGKKAWTLDAGKEHDGTYEVFDKHGKSLGYFVREGNSIMLRQGDHSKNPFDVRTNVVVGEDLPNGQWNIATVDTVEERPRVMIGITMGGSPSRGILDEYGLERDEITVVSGVIDGLPADRAGLMEGDIIVELEGDNPGDIRTLRGLLNKKTPGDTLELTVLREGDRKQFLLGLEQYEQTALRGQNRFDIEETDGNKEILERIEKLKADMQNVGESMAATRDRQKLQELGMKMGELGAELGALSSELALQGLRQSRGFGQFQAPAAPLPQRVIVPQWNEDDGDAPRAFGFFTRPPADGDQFEEMRAFLESLAREQEAEMSQYQQRLEEMVKKMAEESGEARPRQLRGERTMDDRLDGFDDRLDRLEQMIERLLEDRH